MSTVADLLVATLAEIGVPHVFGIVGDALNPFTDALGHRTRSSGSASATRRARRWPPPARPS